MSEIKRGDSVYIRGEWRSVVGFDEDSGTLLTGGEWVCASDLDFYGDDSWRYSTRAQLAEKPGTRRGDAMKTLIVIHTHYSDSSGPTRAYGPYDEDGAESVRAHLAELTSDTYGTGEWRVMSLVSLALEATS